MVVLSFFSVEVNRSDGQRGEAYLLRIFGGSHLYLKMTVSQSLVYLKFFFFLFLLQIKFEL